MKKGEHLVLFSNSEIVHLLNLIADNEEDGTYYGNVNNWDKQTKSIKEKLQKVLEQS